MSVELTQMSCRSNTSSSAASRNTKRSNCSRGSRRKWRRKGNGSRPIANDRRWDSAAILQDRDGVTGGWVCCRSTLVGPDPDCVARYRPARCRSLGIPDVRDRAHRRTCRTNIERWYDGLVAEAAKLRACIATHGAVSTCLWTCFCISQIDDGNSRRWLRLFQKETEVSTTLLFIPRTLTIAISVVRIVIRRLGYCAT